MMVARLQTHIQAGGAEQFGVFDLLDGIDLRMRPSILDMPALSDDFPLLHNDCSDHGIGGYRRPGNASQF